MHKHGTMNEWFLRKLDLGLVRNSTNRNSSSLQVVVMPISGLRYWSRTIYVTSVGQILNQKLYYNSYVIIMMSSDVCVCVCVVYRQGNGTYILFWNLLMKAGSSSQGQLVAHKINKPSSFVSTYKTKMYVIWRKVSLQMYH